MRIENVVQIYSIHEHPIPAIAMEFVAGETLQARIDRLGAIAVRDVIEISRQIAAGLTAAHARGLIHRDIKPSNVLVEEGSVIRIKLSDFGLARLSEMTEITPGEIIAGTPMYMSPEQARGEDLDQRSDLFSFGSVIYAMLCGQPPFRGSNPLSVLKRVCEEPARPLTEIVPGIPPELNAIVHRLLAKRPDERYRVADEVNLLLTKICLNEPALGAHEGDRSKDSLVTLSCTALLSSPRCWNPSLAAWFKLPSLLQRSRCVVICCAVIGAIGSITLTRMNLAPGTVALAEKGRPATSISPQDSPSNDEKSGKQLNSEIQKKAEKLNNKAELSDKGQSSEKRTAPPRPDVPTSASGHSIKLFNHPLISADWEWAAPENLGRQIYPTGPIREAFVSRDERTLLFRHKKSTMISTRTNTLETFPPASVLTERRYRLFPSLSEDGLILSFSASGGIGHIDLWEQRRSTVSEPFGAAQNLGTPLNSASSDGQSTYSSDGLMLIFCSARPGGLGSEDLWIAKRSSVQQPFERLRHLGDHLNHSGQDFTPYLTADDQVLLFAAPRQGTIGSFDLWMSIRIENTDEFGPPMNLGPQVNTPDHEGRPCLSADGQTLYFCSDRAGGLPPSDLWCIRRIKKNNPGNE